MSTQITAVQKRGGVHRTHGVYQGGGPLSNSYSILTKSTYRYSMQLRNTKSLEKIEANLHSTLKDLTLIKFKGKLEINSSEQSDATELDKKQFLVNLQDLVTRHGL